jgi:ribosome maturation factor RimP
MIRSSKTTGFLPTESISEIDDEINNDSQEEIDNDVFKEIISLMDTANDDEIEKDNSDSNLNEDNDEDRDYVTSFDDVEDDEESALPRIIPGEQWKESVQSIIKEVIKKQGLYVQKIVWGGSRIEVVIAASDDAISPTGPSSSALQLCHRSMYDEFELREEELGVVTRFEIVVASPGIGETLRTDQDFVSFKGFMVAVTTLEIYKKKTSFEGTLVERNVDAVCISLKGMYK